MVHSCSRLGDRRSVARRYPRRQHCRRAPLWPYEVANALLILRRRKKLDPDDYSEASMLLDRLQVSVDNDGPRLAATRIGDLAMEHKLTVYDAAYLELAVRKQIPLASRDQSLNRAAQRLGVTLLL